MLNEMQTVGAGNRDILLLKRTCYLFDKPATTLHQNQNVARQYCPAIKQGANLFRNSLCQTHVRLFNGGIFHHIYDAPIIMWRRAVFFAFQIPKLDESVLVRTICLMQDFFTGCAYAVFTDTFGEEKIDGL